MVKSIFIVLFAACLTKTIHAQEDESRVKASLIYYFGQFLIWPHESELNEYTIAYLTNDKILINELQLIAKSRKLKNKKIQLVDIASYENIGKDLSVQIIYISPEYNLKLNDIYERIKGKQIVLVSDNANANLYTMLNFKKQNNKLLYEANRLNLNAEGLSYKSDLLLYGGSVVDVKVLLTEGEQKFSGLMKKVSETEAKLLNSEQELSGQNQIIIDLEKKLKNYEFELSIREKQYQALLNEITQKEIILKEKTLLLLHQESQYKSVLSEIKERKTELQNTKLLVNRFTNDMEENRKKIERQNIILKDQKVKLRERNKQIIIVIGLFVLVSSLSVSIFRLYRIKKIVNTELEKKVEERTNLLQKSQRYYLNLFQNTPVSIWEIDFSKVNSYIESLHPESETNLIQLLNNPQIYSQCISYINILDLNFETLNLFNAPSKDYLIEKYADNFRFEEGKRSIIDTFVKIWQKSSKYECESYRYTKDGEKKHLIIRWVALDNEDYSRVLLTMSDITAIKLYEEEINKHRNHLELLVEERTKEISQLNEELMSTNEEIYNTNENLLLNKVELENTVYQLKVAQNQLIQSEKLASIGMLTAGIAHEINNPVNFISAGSQALFGFIREIKDRINSDVYPELHDTFEKIETINQNIQTGIERTTSIVNSMRRYSYANNTVSHSVNLIECIQSALVILQNKYKNRIEIEERFEDTPLIDCFQSEIDQVFMNILANAMDAIENTGKITILVKNVADNNVEIEVTDNGCGFSEDTKKHIFSPFYTTKEVGKGTGLGLYIVYGYIQHHNGTIDIHSKLGEGTSVKITLPIKA